MADNSRVRNSLCLSAIIALLAVPPGCSSSTGSSGTGGTNGGAAGQAAGGHASGGAAATSAGGAGGRPERGGASGSAGGVAGGGAGGAAGSAGSSGGSAGGGAGVTGAAGMAGAASVEGVNLIANGDAEAALGSADGQPVDTPGWTVSGHATAMQYGQDGYPSATDPGPTDRGNNLFIGGGNDALSTLSQTVDVSADAVAIDAGAVTMTLSGYFGGYKTDEDNAVLSATFQDAGGQPVGTTATVGGVTAEDRSGATGLLLRTTQAAVPASTRSIAVVLTMTRMQGYANDGYADDLSLILNRAP